MRNKDIQLREENEKIFLILLLNFKWKDHILRVTAAAIGYDDNTQLQQKKPTRSLTCFC